MAEQTSWRAYTSRNPQALRSRGVAHLVYCVASSSSWTFSGSFQIACMACEFVGRSRVARTTDAELPLLHDIWSLVNPRWPLPLQ